MMKRLNNIILLLVCAGLSCLLIACSEKLDIPQNGALTESEFYQTDEDAESSISTVYCYWREMYETRMTLLTTLSDEASKGGMNVNFFSTWKDRNSFVFNSNNEGLTSYYKGAYTLIYYCNLVIELVKGDTDTQRRCVAEAKFFRAYTYFHLAALWGETVPVVDHLLAPEEYHVSRSAKGELWSLVEQDLKEAIAVLPSKTSKDDKSQYRVTKEAAETMLGKAYLWQDKNAEAAEAFDKVIDSRLYDLWDGDYDLLMHVEANDCPEKVLDARMPNDQDNYQKNRLNRVNAWWGYLGWSSRFMKQSPQANQLYASGENYLAPRKELYDAFVAEEGEDGYRLKSTLRTVWQMADEGVVVTTDMPDHDLYFNWKNRELNSDLMGTPGGRGADNQYINMPYIRYAEVLLLAAEAWLKNGNQQKAETYLNKVRQRARLADKTGITLEDIKTEKQLELCFEGVRYMDLIRWGDAYEKMKDQGKETYMLKVQNNGTPDNPDYSYSRVVSDTNPNAGFKQGKNELLPIPMSEMEVNGSYMTQNPGW